MSDATMDESSMGDNILIGNNIIDNNTTSAVEIPSICWDYPTPFVLDVEVNTGHIDGLNHVNNAVYVSWCQDAGWGHSLALGLGLPDYYELDRGMAIRRSEFDYVQSAYVGEKLKVGTWLTGNDNRLSMERRFQLVRISDGATLLRARWDLVCIEISSGRPKRMPPVFKAVYGGAVITS